MAKEWNEETSTEININVSLLLVTIPELIFPATGRSSVALIDDGKGGWRSFPTWSALANHFELDPLKFIY